MIVGFAFLSDRWVRLRPESFRNPSAKSQRDCRTLTGLGFRLRFNACLNSRRAGCPLQLLTLIGCFWLCAIESTLSAAQNPSATNDIFSTGYVGKLNIEISPQGMASLRKNSRTYVPAAVREGETIYTNVAVHLKGGLGSFQNVDEKPSFTLNFSKFAEGQTFHGFKKIHLNSSRQDGTFLNEKISRDLFNAAGVPMARATHAFMELNGKDLGLHVMVEGFNKQFFKRYFTNANGNLYEGGYGRDVSPRLPVNDGDVRTNHVGMKALVAAVREPDPELRRVKLEQALDVDRFLSFMAMEIMLAHWDGYTIGVNNYRVFHDLGSGKMVFIPHGTDQVLGESNQGVMPEARGLVARTVLDVPEFNQRYHDRMTRLLTNVFVTARITNAVREAAARIDASAAGNESGKRTGFEQRVNGACRRVARREEFLRSELLRQDFSLAFDAAGAAKLDNWKAIVASGQATMDARTNSKLAQLCIKLEEPGSASWRSEVTLSPGKYRLAGRVKLSGVEIAEGEDRAGVCLRILHRVLARRLAGTRDWTEMTFDFEVEKPRTPVAFMCELRGVKGEAFFDLDSLRLLKR